MRVEIAPPLQGSPWWGIKSHPSGPLWKVGKDIPGLYWQKGEGHFKGYYDAVAEAARSLGATMPLHGPRPCAQAEACFGLRTYQVNGVLFIVAGASEGVLLADDVGLGKTAQALRAAKALGGPTVVVCPSFVKSVWEVEAAKWCPNWSIDVCVGTKPQGLTADLVIINYDILHAWVGVLSGAQTVIFDEAHFLQSAKSRRSQAAKALAASCRYRIALTATPENSRNADLANLIDTISPGRVGRFVEGQPWDFYRRYCGLTRKQVSEFKSVYDYSGSSNEEELQRRLSTFMLRRTKSDVARELPSLTRQLVEFEVKRQVPVEDIANKRALRAALDSAADAKFDAVVDLVLTHARGAAKVVVFTHRRSIAETLTEALQEADIDAHCIHGAYRLLERRETIALKPKVLVATIDSIGVGVDMSYASVGVFAELDWVPAKLLQAEGRLHRFGAREPVLIQYCIALGSADELIASAVVRKLETFGKAIGKQDHGLEKGLRKEDDDEMAALYRRIMKAQEEDDA